MVPCWSMLHSAGIRFRQGRLEEKDPPIRARRLLETWIRERQEFGEIRSEIHPEVAAIGMIVAHYKVGLFESILFWMIVFITMKKNFYRCYTISFGRTCYRFFSDSSKGNSL